MIPRASNKPHAPNPKALLSETASRAAAKAEQSAQAPALTDWIDEEEEKLERLSEADQEASQDDVAVAEGSPAFTGAATQVAEAAPVAASDAAPAAAGTVAVASAGVPPVLLAIGGIGLIAAASSGGGGDTPAAPQATFDGKAIDGYLAGATVFVDVDGDGQLDAGEPSDTTDADGDFTLPQVAGEIVAFGGTDIATGLAFTGVLKAPSGATVVTPLTTLMADLIAGGETAEAAQAIVLAALGLGDLEVDLTTLDPVAAAGEGDTDALALHKAGVTVATLVANLTESVRETTGAGEDHRDEIARDIFAALSEQLESGGLAAGNVGEAAEALLDALLGENSVGGLALTDSHKTDLSGQKASLSEQLQDFSDALGEVTNLSDIGHSQRAALEGEALPVHRINASVDGLGDVITLYFDRALDSEHAPSISQFSVDNNGAQTLSGVQVVNNQVILKLAAPLNSAHAVKVSYTDAGTGNDTNGIQDADGVDASSFTDVVVRNTLSLNASLSETFTHATSLSLAGAEISAFDAASARLFVTAPAGVGLQVVQVNADLSMTLLGTVSLGGNDINSVAVKNGLVAVAVAAADKTQPGSVYFLDADASVADPAMVLGSVSVGALPDMLTFTPDGSKVLVANEAEQDTAGNNPEGSVSIIDLSAGVPAATVTTAGFSAFNDKLAELQAAGVRLFAGEAGFETLTVAQDLEPEYIAISPDGTTAFVTLQENNAIGILDLATGQFTDIVPLGLKSFLGLPFDGSDRDGAGNSNSINLQTDNPVFGQYMPDSIASFTGADGRTYFVIANEGDDRDDFITPDETARVSSLNLDDTAFPNEAALKTNAEIGRLTVSNAPGNNGDTDGDGDIDQILAYGGRSFSILNADGVIVFDSGSHTEQFVAAAGLFTGATGAGLFDDTRSDNKGSEPEGVTIGQVGGKTLAFVGLERGGGGVMVYDVTDPGNVAFVQYLRQLGDTSPEGLTFVDKAHSPTGQELLFVSNEVSNTVSLYSNQSLINGVASGDTTQDATVLWAHSTRLGNVTFEYGTDPDFATVLGSVSATVTDASLPVKVDVAGLSANTDYYYRVTDAGGDRETGSFHTAAALGEHAGLSFGVSGDWRGELSPYPAVANAAAADLDFFVLHGDTIYADYPSPDVPLDQASSLADYRAKQNEVYSTRNGIDTLAELRASTSVLATIDDHEVTDDFAGGAAPASDPRFAGDPAVYINDTALYETGLQAFQEYNPIRNQVYDTPEDALSHGEIQLYRYQNYGSDAAVMVLDARSFRDAQLVNADIANPSDVGRFLAESFTPDRTMLGETQLADLKADLLDAQAKGVTWKFVMLPEPIQNFGPLAAADRYEGYAAERTELLAFIETNGIKNVVFVSADIHGTVVNNLTYQAGPGQEQIATGAWEISTGAVAFDQPFGPTVVDLAQQAGLISGDMAAYYGSLPSDARNAFVHQLVDSQLAQFGYDPVGLDNNLAAADGRIAANLLTGDWVAAETYGWTEFKIDPVTQELRVITYGVDPYDAADLNGVNLGASINQTPRVVSEFTVTPELGDFRLQLLHFADAEAGLLASQTAPNLAALVDAFEDDYVHSITLAGGDNFIPGPFLAAGTDSSIIDDLNAVTGSTLSSTATVPIGAVDIAIHNAIGVEASAIGNHEYDLGSRVLKDAIAGSSGSKGAQFPFISANLDFSGDSDLKGLYSDTTALTGLEAASSYKGKIVPSAVLEEGGEKIGLVGATTQILEAISSPSGTEVKGFPTGAGANGEVDNMDLLAAQLQPVIDDLISQGVNKIILMAHLQVIGNEKLLASKLSGVDIILSAGSNTRLGDADDTAVAFPGHAATFADTYPLVIQDKDGNDTLIVNTDNEFTYLGRLVVDFDANGHIVTQSLAANAGINGAYAATDANVADAWGVAEADLATTAFADGTRGDAVKTLTDAVQDVITVKDGNVYGYSDVYLEGERLAVRNQETNLGDLSADANAYAAEQALGAAAATTFMVSIKNGGGIRAQIGTISAPDPVDGTVDKLPPTDGSVSQLDVENSLRFNNQLMVFETTAEGLKAILEHGVASLGNQGRFPQLGGVAFSYDPDLPAGSRISDIALTGEGYTVNLYNDGVKLDSAPSNISLVTLNFLANGGDSYPMKANGSNFRYLMEGADGSFSLSAAVDEALNYTDAGVIATYVTGGNVLLGEQAAFEAYMQAFHATPETAYDQAETPEAEDARIQNLNVRAEDVLNPGEEMLLVGQIALPASEITAYHGDSRTAFVVGGNDEMYVVSLADPAHPELLQTIQLAGKAQSVAVNADGLVALAVSQMLPVAEGSAATYQGPGLVQFFQMSGAQLLAAGQVTVGALPDSLTFNDAGTILVTANEGEPNLFFTEAESKDPAGSISIINIDAATPANSTVTTLGFEAYNGKLEQLRDKGVRISGDDAADGIIGNLVAQDMEPEYVSITGNTAYVSLQENNAIAVVNLDTKKITAINPVGLKDWTRGEAEATTAEFSLTYPGTRPDFDGNGQLDDGEVTAGGLSGLWYSGKETVNGVAYDVYYSITDRGPQAAAIGDREGDNPSDPAKGGKIFDDPDYPITVYKLGMADGEVVELGSTSLKVPDGVGGFRNATGLGMLDRSDAAYQLTGVDGEGFNTYERLGKDQFGLDTESILHLSIAGLNGGNPVFAIADEYGPQIALFDAASGNLIHRIMPANTDFAAASGSITWPDLPAYTLETLPENYSTINNNRGFEAMAYNSSDGLLYAFVQSPLRPSGYKNQEVVRIIAVDPLTGEAKHEYLYPLSGESGQDKMGDAVYDAARDVFYVIERDSGVTANANKTIFEINLTGATDVLDYTQGSNGQSWSALIGVAQPELLTAASLADALAVHGIDFAHKNELLNIPSLGIDPRFDKAEGLALKPDGTLVVGFDNDFVHVDGRPDNLLAEIRFNPLDVDTSDKDGGINPGYRPFYGLRMPDGIDSYQYNGETFVVMANEGDGRVRPDVANYEVGDAQDDAYLKISATLADGVTPVATLEDAITGVNFHVLTTDAADPDAVQVAAGDEYFLTLKYGWQAPDFLYNDETRVKDYDDLTRLEQYVEDHAADMQRLKTVNTESYFSDAATLAGAPEQLIGFGGRSFSIMDSKGNLVYDSGTLTERAAMLAGQYDDGRSDDKGTEPENVTLAEVNGTIYAYVGLERANSVVVFDVTNPYDVSFVQILPVSADTGFISPEGLVAHDGMLIVSNEVTPGLAIYAHKDGLVSTYTPNIGTTGGSSDASTAFALDSNYMIVADDEANLLRVYPREGGAAVLEWSYASNGPMLAKELDLEAGAKVGDTLYLIGSHSNKKDGSDAEADRSHLFAVTVSGTGAETQFTYVGKFDELESELIAWDVNNSHGLGADYFGFAASAADGVSPERIDGFSIEGMATSPDHSALWLAFRAPQTTEARDHALIVPVTNYTALVAGTATDATFGAPIQLDLGGRGIRSISQAADGTYLIIAGPAASATEAVDRDFVLFTWDGNIAHEAVELGNNLDALRDATGGSFESIVSMPNTPSTGDYVQLLMDNGDTVWEGETDISKDLPDAEQQFQGVWVKLQAAYDDTAGPVLKSATPADGTVGANVNGDIVLTFNESVARGDGNSSGNLVLHKADGTVVETFDMASSERVTVNYNVVTVDPTAPLEYDTGYYVTLASGAIRDHAGNSFAGFSDATSLNFTASGVPTPLAAGDILFVAGNAEATDAMAFVLLKDINGGTGITFTDRDYSAATGYAGITNEAAFVWTADQNYAAGTVVTIQTDVDGNPLADKGSTLGAGGGLGKSETYYAFQGGSIASLAEGAAGEITSVGTFLASLTLGGAAGDIPAELTTAGSALSFTINPANQTNARYTGSLDAGDLAALAARIKNADNWEANYTKAPGFPLVDDSFFGAPLLSEAEVNGATLTLTWNQPLDAAHAPLAGAFAVTINGTPVAVNNVAISGDTVTLTLATAAIGGDTVALSYTDPSNGNDVHAIQLLNGSDAATRTSQSVLNLSPDSTPPTLSSSNIADEATGVATFADLVLTFNEAIAKGSGNITFKGLDGAADVVVDVTSAAVTLSGNQVTVNPTDLLAAGKQYAVQIDATAFTDVAGNAYAGIANDTHLNFTTSARPEYSLLITEMNSNASGGDFFELYNYGATAIDLSGWRMTDEAGVYSGAVAFPEGVSIAAGATLTVAMAETPDDLAAFKAAWGLGTDDQVIAIDGPGLGKQDAVVVFDAAGYVAAAFNYDLTSVIASDGTDITTAATSAGVTFADGQHAGTAYNGGVAADKASAVWDGESLTAPAYKVAMAGQHGAYAQADAASIGSPGALPFGVVGDLVFLAANADATDAFAFQFMKAVSAGTEIVFTDRNYSEATGMPTSGESAYVWTADVDYAAGTLVTIQPDNANPTTDKGTVVGEGGGISTSAETLYAFTGAVDGLGSGTAGALTVDTFLAAINVGGAAAGDIPASLAGGPGAYVSFSQEDVFYSGLAWQGRADTASFLAGLENASQWNAGDSPAHQLTDGSLYGAPASLTPISAIQGAGSASAMLNSYVWVEAVVSAVTPGASGFYLQEEAADSDGNDATSEGIFVYHGSNVPGITSANIGDTVRLYAQVAEYNGLTELKNLSNVQVVRDGNSVDVPAAVSLTLPVVDYALWEQYEGMLVEVRAASGDLTVTDNYNLGRYGSVTLSSGGILEQFTENSAPGVAAYSAYSAATQANQIILDDGSSAQNPDPEIFARAGNDLSAGNTLRAGDTTSVIRGVLDQFATGSEYSYETTYRVQATEDPLFSGTARPTAADLQAALGSAEVKVASVNVLNFFSTFGSADFTTPYGTAQSGRGADDAGEYQRQLDKLLDNLFGLDADVYGLMEIQNNGYGEGAALDALVAAMNARAGSEKYAYIAGPFDDGDGVDEPTAGDDAIMVALIYDATAVAPLGQAAVPDADVYDAFGATYGNRVPVAQTFQSLTDGETFTVAVNHLKSKGSVLDADLGDGQGANNLARMEGVTDLATWLASNPTGAPDGDILLIGDLNAYSMEYPVAYLTGNGYTKLNDGLSYSFDGLWGALDHALASASLASQVISAVEWAINAEEPSVLDYNTNFKSVGQIADFYAADAYRSSDHNPLLIGLNLSGGAADTQAPELQTASANGDTIRLGYDENLKPGNLPAAEHFSVSVNGGDGPAVVSIAVRGGELSLTLAAPLAFGDTIALGYADPAGDDVEAIQDIAGNDAAALVGQVVVNQTPVLDITAPSLVSSSPADDATGVAVGASLVLTFDEPMQKGTGAIVIRHAADDSVFESIDVASDQVSVSGTEVTLNPAANLALGSGYYVEMTAGVFTDAAGNDFAGIQGDAALNFSSQPGTSVFISELHYDNAGTDSNEAVGITGPAGTDLTGWSVVFYNGNGGAPYSTLALSGSIDDEGAGYGELAFTQPASPGIQNGAPDGLALVDNFGQLLQFLSYEGSLTGVGGAADGVGSTDIGVSEAGTEIAGLSLQLSGSGHVYESLLWNSPATASLGSLNPGLIV